MCPDYLFDLYQVSYKHLHFYHAFSQTATPLAAVTCASADLGALELRNLNGESLRKTHRFPYGDTEKTGETFHETIFRFETWAFWESALHFFVGRIGCMSLLFFFFG